MKALTETLAGNRMPGLAKNLLGRIPPRLRETARLRALGLIKIPLLFFLSPSVVELDDYRCVVRIPLTRRSRNHLRSMYFGALAAGADCAGGLMAWKMIEEATSIKAPQNGQARETGKISLVFKDFRAEFLKRAEGDVFFTCEDGQAIRALVEQVAYSGERGNLPVHVVATVPSKLGNEPVARFTLTLSLKKSEKKPEKKPEKRAEKR